MGAEKSITLQDELLLIGKQARDASNKLRLAREHPTSSNLL